MAMKPDLEDLFEWLKRSEKNRFEVYDVDKNASITKCASYHDLTEGGTTLEEYFARLVSKGVRTVQIVKKRKNGSTYVREGCGLNYGLTTEAENNVAASGRLASPAATPQQSFGLGSPGTGMAGLSFPEVMNMRSQADRYEETKEKARQMETRIERLEAENRQLEKENLTYKLGADSKPSAVDKLVEGLAENPAALSSIIQSLKGGGGSAPTALNAPADKNLSDTKSQIIDTISNPQITDDQAASAYYILLAYATGNEALVNEYHQLLISHNIIENAGNNTRNSAL